jgi:hypothetical protein
MTSTASIEFWKAACHHDGAFDKATDCLRCVVEFAREARRAAAAAGRERCAKWLEEQADTHFYSVPKMSAINYAYAKEFRKAAAALRAMGRGDGEA